MPSPTGQDVLTTEKRVVALKLRASGRTYREIAAEMGQTLSYAYQLVHDGLAEIRTAATEDSDEARAIEVTRLDALTVSLTAKLQRQQREVTAPDGVQSFVPDPDEATISALLRVMERRAKLLGLDAPQEIVGAGGGPIQVSNVAAGEEFMGRVEKMIARLEAGEKPEDVAASIRATATVVPAEAGQPSTNGNGSKPT
jgi:hypothetical protein